MWRQWLESISGSRANAGFFATVLTASLGVGFCWFSTEVLAHYGWTLFVLTPVLLGFNCAILYSMCQVRTRWQVVSLTFQTMALMGGLVVVVALDGIICVAMALPLAMLLGTLGALIGWNVTYYIRSRRIRRLLVLALSAAAPLLMAFEAGLDATVPISTVRTIIEIDAPVATVWKFVPEFPSITEPPAIPFRAGIAYPIGSKMKGNGVGASRWCILSTGSVTETVTAWEPERLLAFDVLETPPSMKELSIYRDIHPAHLEHFYQSKRGFFRLVPLEGGRTRLEGTSVYENRLWPAAYWNFISDSIVRQIHLRVFRHIKHLAEEAQRAGA